MIYTRRDLGKMALAALPAASLFAKPNSDFGGVQIGIIVSPTTFRDMPLGAGELLKKLVDAGISAVEMQAVRVELDAGAPVNAGGGSAAAPGGRQSKRARSRTSQEEGRNAAQQLRSWRLAASMDKYKAVCRTYSDAGVKIYALRAPGLTTDTPEDELAYFFNTAEALGAGQITLELPKNPEVSQRLGAYAATRKIFIGYHNHTQVNFNSWDTALSQSTYNGINFDVGHFTAAVSQSPIPFIQKHHDRITSLHLKDRKLGTSGGQNVPWGQGDTPLKEILLMMKREKYKFPAGIELEYRIPDGSTTMAEITKCVQFCKNVLA